MDMKVVDLVQDNLSMLVQSGLSVDAFPTKSKDAVNLKKRSLIKLVKFQMNFKTLGKPVNGGYMHPLLKVRSEFRKILLSMGFSEMPTNQYVESSFWNFDSLFQPQSHPARDAHDTFFIKGMFLLFFVISSRVTSS